MSLQLAAGVFDDVGVISTVEELDVSDAGITVYTPSANTRGVMLQNTGSTECWVGGSTSVDPDTSGARHGIILLPRQSLMFRNIKSTFTLGLRSESGVAATTVGVLEYV